MSKPAMKGYPAEFKERAVKLAVESEQPIAQTARDLGVNDNTLYTWIGKYHRVERQEQQVHDEHLYEELKRLRKDNARLKEERDILQKAAAYFAQQLPESTRGFTSSTPSSRSVAFVSFWKSHGVVLTNGSAVHQAALGRTPTTRCRAKCSSMLRRGVAPTARAGSSI